jgi:hypothetical protein
LLVGGNRPKALAEYLEASKLDPSRPETFELIGRIYLKQGRKPKQLTILKLRCDLSLDAKPLQTRLIKPVNSSGQESEIYYGRCPPKRTTGEIFGWMVYDWANSAFFTVVVGVLIGPTC